MSKRSEKRALELFPVDMQMCIDSTGEPYEADVNEPRRKYVAFGYEQAAKEVMRQIHKYLVIRLIANREKIGLSTYAAGRTEEDELIMDYIEKLEKEYE